MVIHRYKLLRTAKQDIVFRLRRVSALKGRRSRDFAGTKDEARRSNCDESQLFCFQLRGYELLESAVCSLMQTEPSLLPQDLSVNRF
jgi:hypothetical protein